ncbi:hypothetical protein [Photobacterium phosphoreum]|uniref:hypothetical protein n=1 Tax=Photobacterium phosphoreum TaxID=659 RepID=UPI0005D40D91|nr:hypothetical protein [Photobacterium phosphoreum]KJF86537.1 hypothetical protein UB41_10895 [Photobacterium phosphoreum]PSV68850.1 hypothetical protein CTM77_15990 [Photobacterium phosphoreum]
MTLCFYLLTYSVNPFTNLDSDKEKANKVRAKIADISHNDWNKSENVETTFKGSFIVNGITREQKEAASKDFVKEQFVHILREYDASCYDVKIECEMMISEIYSSFSFDVTWSRPI